MTIPIEFIVLGRPASVNGPSEKKRRWKTRVNRVARIALLKSVRPAPAPAATLVNVTVKVFFFPPDKQYCDVDNGLKHTIDAIAPSTRHHAKFVLPPYVIADDKVVQRIVVERFPPAAGARLVTSIGTAATLLQAIYLGNGGRYARKRMYATAVKVESYNNGGALW